MKKQTILDLSYLLIAIFCGVTLATITILFISNLIF